LQALFFNHLYDPISLVRDNEVKAAMCSLGVHCQSFNGDVLYEPWEVLAEGARPFTSFGTFWSRQELFHCVLTNVSDSSSYSLLACKILYGAFHEFCCRYLCIMCPSGWVILPWGLLTVQRTPQGQSGCSFVAMLEELLVRCCRVQKMPYPPPIPLPVPAAVPPQPPDVAGMTLDALELMSEEEAESNEQLYHSVSIQLFL
jgi:hypothetical protein